MDLTFARKFIAGKLEKSLRTNENVNSVIDLQKFVVSEHGDLITIKIDGAISLKKEDLLKLLK